MRKFFLGLLATIPAAIVAQTTKTSTETKGTDKIEEIIQNFRPKIHGTIRGKYEYQPDIDGGRFQVRNARFSLTGEVNKYVEYKAEIDFSEKGSIKMLDAYTRLSPFSQTNFTIGQMRVPFSIDAHRSPHSQYFSNRSFIAKQVGNVRDVGLATEYKFKNIPLRLQAGIFNGDGIKTQNQWHTSINFSAKAQYFPTKNWNITFSAQKISPSTVDINLYDIGSYIEFFGFHVEAEYLFKHYAKNSFNDVNALNTFISYTHPLKNSLFHRIRFLVRYDRMDDHWNGDQINSTQLSGITEYARQRITTGITLIVDKPMISELRLNYEDYSYENDGIPELSEQDKICLEMMVRF